MEASLNTKDKIFIVDDDQLSANLYRQYLITLGFEDIHLFSNGRDCLNALVEEPQLIFLDHMMEHLTGIEVLKKIKRFDPDIYVIFISGQEDISTAVDSLKHGAFDYIIKGEKDTDRIKDVLSRINNIREQLKRKDNEDPGFFRRMLSLIV